MYIIFTNRAFILNFLMEKNKLEQIFCEEGSYAENFCINKNLIYNKYTSKKDSFKMLNKLINKKIILN